MSTNGRTLRSTRAAATVAGAIVMLVMAATAAVTGCAAVGKQLPPRITPPPVAPVEVVPPPPPPPPPTQAELALGAAHEADRSGDCRAAIEHYRRAASLTIDGARLADIHYALAVLQADPNNPDRNVTESRAQLQRFLDAPADRPGQREARALAKLIDEVTEARAESAAVKGEIETLRTQVADLNKQLADKDKELSGIKKVLLQNKIKP